MTAARVLELMRVERQCVSNADECDRDCTRCELVQDTGELLAAYDEVVRVYKVLAKWEDQ